MDLIRKVLDYRNEPLLKASYYTENESILGTIAFYVIMWSFAIFTWLAVIVVCATSPVWIIPYLIYRTIKHKKEC